ncbi:MULTISPECIES: hypothetical protein [unclassified Streptomyces]|uniref:hypothetical protein n=1 Tax=unclassified Streptomyces TaxID=2593676 RepID=UPI0004C514FD|nr:MULTISPECIES: hypothetical protein [unclassified Streptomyces]
MSAIAARQTIELERDPAHIDFQEIRPVPGAGDFVHAAMPKGRWAGTWTGRISVRASGKHSLSTPVGRCTVSHRNLRLLQRADGYAYSYRQEVTE